MSKKSNLSEEKFSSYELEALAIVESLKELCLSIGQQIQDTDCSDFQKSMNEKGLKPTNIVRWNFELMKFD